MGIEENTAFEKYGHFNSTHEVYGVLIEEVQEFFEIVREKPAISEAELKTKTQRMINELNQIRAIAQRAMNELSKDQIKHV